MANDKNNKRKAPPPPEREFDWGVPELAKELGIEEASVRVALRNANIKKAGRSYGWDSKAEMLKVAEKLRANKKTAGAPKKSTKPVAKKRAA